MYTPGLLSQSFRDLRFGFRGIVFDWKNRLGYKQVRNPTFAKAFATLVHIEAFAGLLQTFRVLTSAKACELTVSILFIIEVFEVALLGTMGIALRLKADLCPSNIIKQVTLDFELWILSWMF